ncbi:MobH family relaxase [Carnimonas bestiolae]|uniref:MobH family relaxase n=1 Tax=Carnimonas bestiolae TaxID=3402172 RepID=UPI003EDBC83B
MLKLFSRKSTTTSSNAAGEEKDLHKVLSAQQLLSTPHRRRLIKQIWDTTSLTKDVFDVVLQAPIERFACLVQSLPASENHHHAYPGGLLDHALESAVYGLKLRQSHLLPPGARPEDQSSAGEVWSAAVVYGALMHDAAKPLTDMEIVLKGGEVWSLWSGNIPSSYHVRYRKGRNYHLHEATSGALAERILGGEVLTWLMSQDRLFPLFMFTLAGHPERGGIIAQLISQADRASVAKAMGGNPVQALSAPVESLQRKLADGLRYLVREKMKLNQRGAQAWLTDTALWVVTPQVINQLKSHLLEQGIKSIPAEISRVYGELSAHGIIEEVSEGKNVWKVEIVDGEWKNTFNMIQVPPALIWPEGNRPKSFTGQVVVEGASEQEVNTTDTEITAPTSDAQQPKTTSSNVSASPAELPEPQESAATSSIDDDLLALFDPLDGKEGRRKDESTELPPSSSDSDSKSSHSDQGQYKSEEATTSSGLDTTKTTDPDDLGHQFWLWLKEGITTHSLIINDTKSMVHVVNNTYFLVSPNIFKAFSKEQLGDDSHWKQIQRRFQRLNVHRRHDSLNIHKVVVDNGSEKSPSELKGYLLRDPTDIAKKVPANNWVLRIAEAT